MYCGSLITSVIMHAIWLEAYEWFGLTVVYNETITKVNCSEIIVINY